MALILNKDHFDFIKREGERSFPNECCGFMLGKVYENKEVIKLLPAENEREDSEQYHRFLITPEAYMQSDKYARANNLDIIGFYHSHPNAEARPSEYDREHGWPWYSYAIVSVKAKKAGEMTAWVLQDDRLKFIEEKIIVQ